MIPSKCIHDIQIFEDANVNLVGVLTTLWSHSIISCAFSGFNIGETLAVTAEFTFTKNDLQS